MDALQTSLDVLLDHPEIAGRFETKLKILQNLRVWQVKGFENHLIFYQARRGMIVVFRILHGNRDAETLLINQHD